jgi:oligopeptide/dipeptide ABC transporter ATP-binding protein
VNEVLALSGVSVDYQRGRGAVRAVSNVDLHLNKGEILGLVGESGCGKSSLGKAIVGILPPATGSVRFEGDEVRPLTRRSRPLNQRRLQMIFQDPYGSLNPRRTVGEQLSDGLRITGVKAEEARQRSGALLERVGLTAGAHSRYPHQFSGGQRQRIAIARALAAEPSVIVADEPISALDASAQASVANLLVELVRDLGMGMIFISHDLSVVRTISDRVAVMYLGNIVEMGRTQDVWETSTHPYTRALIGAIPHADGSGTLPQDLPGDVPNPMNPPTGCRFHPRCTLRQEQCSTVIPPLVTLSDGRQVACVLQNSGAAPVLLDATMGV